MMNTTHKRKSPRATIRYGALHSEVRVVKEETGHDVTIALPVAEPGRWHNRQRAEFNRAKGQVAKTVCELLGITDQTKEMAA